MASSAPLMKTSMELQIPITLIKPNLDEIQSSFSQVLNNILDTHKAIVMWGQRDVRKTRKASLKFASDGKLYFQLLFTLYSNISLQKITGITSKLFLIIRK